MQIFKKEKNTEFIIAIFLVLVGVALRLVPHAPNFTPISAIALFGGVYFSRRTAFVLPVLAILISDLFIGFYDFKIMAAVYGSFILSVALGLWLKNHKKWHLIVGGAILSSVLFFLITNFAVFAFSPWYAKSLSGLIQCYVMALPFFKNTLLGDIFYTAVFFGAYETVLVLVKKIVASKNKLAVIR
ncbi:MAG: hypothetical protein Q8Q48_03160 [Candidatus Staskawiczbacteria bacterium]|nr:hypothetical protein [Candidatus Staskawiczbacteria bacterium]